MREVLCPICNQEVIGEGEVDLSLHLQDHMREAHKIQNLHDLESDSNRSVHEPSTPLADQKGDLSSMHHGDSWEDSSEMIRCPFCGELVTGGSEDDLSYNLAKHVNFNHSMQVMWIGKG